MPLPSMHFIICALYLLSTASKYQCLLLSWKLINKINIYMIDKITNKTILNTTFKKMKVWNWKENSYRSKGVIPFLSICLTARGKDLRAVLIWKYVLYMALFIEKLYKYMLLYITTFISTTIILFIYNQSLTISLTVLLSHILLLWVWV